MMTTRGLLNIETNGRMFDFQGKILAYPTQESFVTLYNFLNSSVCQNLGIFRRAYNFGSPTSVLNAGYEFVTSYGTGMDYFDRSAPAGNNAWAVFEFTQATPKFWILIQFSAIDTSTLATFGLSPGAPAKTQGFNSNVSYPYEKSPGLSISMAMRKDSARPWSGTIANNGADTKSTPVWSSGSFAFPRPNQFGADGRLGNLGDSGGSVFLTDASAMMQLREGLVAVNPYNDIGGYLSAGDSSFDSYSGVMHVIVSEDTILVVTDPKGVGQHNFMYFGKYTPLRDSITDELNWANYVCLQQYAAYDGFSPIYRFGETTQTVYGTRYSSQNIIDTFHVTYPKIQGGTNYVRFNETRGVIMSLDFVLNDSSAAHAYQRFPNRAAAPSNGQMPAPYDIFNIPIACYEDHHYYGHLGEIEFIKLTRDIPNNATLNDRQWACFGSTVKNTIKLVVPWDGRTQPGMQGATRTGILW